MPKKLETEREEKVGAKEIGVFVSVNGAETLIRSYLANDTSHNDGMPFDKKAEMFAEKMSKRGIPHYTKKIQ